MDQPVVRRIVAGIQGSLLLVASVLKISSFHAPSPSYMDSIALAILETLLALWLLSGYRLVWSLSTATGLFLIFAMITFWKAAHGESTCGCFGAWSPSPKVTFWIDTGMTAAGIAAIQPRRPILPPVMVLLFALLYFGGLNHEPVDRLDASPQPGRTWPPAGTVDFPEDLSKGRWVILIYSSDCARCQSLANDYASDAKLWTASTQHTRLALLDVNRTGDSANRILSNAVVYGTILRDEIYQHSPILFLVDHGTVLAKEEGWEEVDWTDFTHSSWLR